MFVKLEGACLEYSDKSGVICNEFYVDKNLNNLKTGAYRYHILSDKLVRNRLELVEYCLRYNEDVVIPNHYKIQEVYSIIFTTSDFDPKDRTRSRTWSSVVLTTPDENRAKSAYDSYCKLQINGKEIGKNVYCWHTEDFAYNQVIHSYSLDKSYIVSEEVNS